MRSLLSLSSFILTVGCSDWLYTPIIDGTFIQDRPEALLAQGKVNGDRVWITHNYNEVRCMSDQSPEHQLTALLRASSVVAPQVTFKAHLHRRTLATRPLLNDLGSRQSCRVSIMRL